MQCSESSPAQEPREDSAPIAAESQETEIASHPSPAVDGAVNMSGGEEKQPETKTKQSFREKIWTHMAKEDLTNSFRSLCNRIPYFKGAEAAAQRLTELEEFKEAKLLMISPDKPQEFMIIQSLQKDKEVLIPRPRLLSGLFLRIKSVAGLPEEETKNAVTRHNILQLETPIGFNTADLRVDMVVLGSVCVNKSGYRIGDGEGFADLEYAILSKMKAVDESTIVVTTVHDCQILDDLPNELFEPYDVPVDIIVTPTQTVVINPRLKKPTEIIWSAISKRRLSVIPILNEIKQFEEKEGNSLTLKDVDSDVQSRVQEKLRVKKVISKLQPKGKKLNSESVLKENEKSKEIRRRPFVRKRKLQKSKENTENNESTGKTTENQGTDGKPRQTRSQRPNLPRNHVDFSLRLSNIASTVRVRDLKSALLERGVKPSNITWRGQRGFCYLHFGKLRRKDNVKEQEPVQVDSIVANLQQLKIGAGAVTNENSFIIVEPAEPVTRIEVTDVSAV